jgi:hypothetical protein
MTDTFIVLGLGFGVMGIVGMIVGVVRLFGRRGPATLIGGTLAVGIGWFFLRAAHEASAAV